MHKTIALLLTTTIFLGCASTSETPRNTPSEQQAKPIFEDREKVYECRQKFASDRFLFMNNDGSVAKVRFLGQEFLGDYEVKDLQREFWFGSMPDQDGFEYLVVLETDGSASLYDFSNTKSYSEEVLPSRELSCSWSPFYY